MDKRKVVRNLNLTVLSITGIGALAGGFGLMMDPSGESLGMSTDILPEDLFPNFLIPGLLLFFVIGFGHAIVAVASVKMNCAATWKYIFFTGVVLTGWIIVQVMLIGHLSILQPIYLGIGILEMILALLWKRTAWQRNKYHF